jgi:hypothetical protein
MKQDLPPSLPIAKADSGRGLTQVCGWRSLLNGITDLELTVEAPQATNESAAYWRLRAGRPKLVPSLEESGELSLTIGTSHPHQLEMECLCKVRVQSCDVLCKGSLTAEGVKQTPICTCVLCTTPLILMQPPFEHNKAIIYTHGKQPALKRVFSLQIFTSESTTSSYS